MDMDELEAGLQPAWDSTCRILFGQELGPLSDYHAWLAELVDPVTSRRSSVSGQDVIFSMSDYAADAPFIGLEELDWNKKYPPPDPRSLEDADSIAKAVRDRAQYAGNIVLGNSRHVRQSSNIIDCHFVLRSTLLSNSKRMAFCTQCELDDSSFGGNAFSESAYCLKCHEGTRIKRNFELWMSQDSSDCYYSHGLKNCADCIFCFNLQNKRHCIGNLELPPDQYKKIKTRLLAEFAQEAKKNKRLPSLIELVKASKAPAPKPAIPGFRPAAPPAPDKSKIEAAFSKTFALLFGPAPSHPIDAYGPWLVRHARGLDKCRSALSGQPLFLAQYGNYSDLPRDRLLTLEEAQAFGREAKWQPSDLEGLSLSSVPSRLRPLAYFNTGIEDGQNTNNLECAINITASDCYRAVCSAYSKSCAYTFWPQSSEACFGSNILFYCRYCINCYQSSHLSRCLELDGCNSCSDSLFCHHCENLSDCMFCFNAKNLKYAIGNVVVGKEAYQKAKAAVLGQLAAQLEKKQALDLDIFSLGR